MPLPDVVIRALQAAGYRASHALPGEGDRRLLVRADCPGERWMLRAWRTGAHRPPAGSPWMLPFEPLLTEGQVEWGVIPLGRGRIVAELAGPVLGRLPEQFWFGWRAVSARHGWIAPEQLVWGPEGVGVVPSDVRGGEIDTDRALADARARLEGPHDAPPWAGITSAGVRRYLNEDTWRVVGADGQVLAVVVDGLGGFHGGERAAFHVASAFAATTPAPAHARLAAGLAAAYTALQADKGPEVDAGATFAAAVLEGRRLTVGWMGDVCAWRFAGGKLLALNEPHTLVQELVRRERIRPEEARGHPHANILLRSVGASFPESEMDVTEVELAPGDQALLASDGLWRSLEEGEITRVLAAARSPRDAVVRLHGAALDAGASDNVTAVILSV